MKECAIVTKFPPCDQHSKRNDDDDISHVNKAHVKITMGHVNVELEFT